MYMLLNVKTPMHACTHTHVCMHVYARIHLYICTLMKSIKIKANDFHEKKKYMHVVLLQVSEVNKESFWLLYYLKSI